jgi:hypothetical protein
MISQILMMSMNYEIIANNIFRVLCELDNLSDQVDITKKGA